MNNNIQADLFVSGVKIALYDLHIQNTGNFKSLNLIVEPIGERAVKVAENIPMKKCVLVPFSPSVDLTKSMSDKVQQGAVHIGEIFENHSGSSRLRPIIAKLMLSYK